jgi:hypothetical protein
MPAGPAGLMVKGEVDAVINQEQGPLQRAGPARTLPRAAALSFTFGLIALRVCWLPGVNCALAGAALSLGIVGFCQILRARGACAGLEEAISGVVLGAIVLGLSVFFIAALVAAYR